MSDHTKHNDDHDLGYILDEEASTSSISVIAGLFLIIALLAAIAMLTQLFIGHSQNRAPDASIIEAVSNLIV